MNEYGEGKGAWPEGLARRIDAACDHFEDAWQRAGAGGEPPRLADFLALVAEEDRAALLPELLALDREFRRARGEWVPLEEQLRELPALPEALLARLIHSEQASRQARGEALEKD